MAKSSKSKEPENITVHVHYLKDSDNICQINDCGMMAQVKTTGIITVTGKYEPSSYYLCHSCLAAVLENWAIVDLVED